LRESATDAAPTSAARAKKMKTANWVSMAA
jgi:hypothetical protein